MTWLCPQKVKYLPLLEGVPPYLSLFVVVCLPAGETPQGSGLLTTQLSSFGMGLCLPTGPLLDLSEPYWVAWPHGVKVSSWEGTSAVAPCQLRGIN